MQKKQVVFIEGFPTAMVYKIAKEFRKRGYETVLIRILKANNENYGFYKQAYDKIIDIDIPYVSLNKKNFLKIVWMFFRQGGKIFSAFLKIFKLKPYIVFGRAPISVPIAFFRIFFKKSAFVYFPYDIRRQAFPNLKIAKKNIGFFEMIADNYCFEHSDGILHKGASYELKDLQKRKLIDLSKLPKHEVSIYPYCSKDFIVPFNKNKLSKKDGEIHMVYVGGTGKKNEKFYFEQLKSVDMLIKKGIHAHFHFGSEISSDEEREREELVKKNFFEKYKDIQGINYFHLEKSFNAKDIAREISKYDFGFWPECEYDVRLATGNKFSTFIEAGIPFFYFKKHEINDEIAKEYGLGILHADGVKNFKEFISKLDYDKLIEGVKKARENYLMEKHFSRLEEFVERVVRGKRG
ncbi:hypothetical protein HOE04_02745 [archaeon]|jgi:hypothetical protein|nr:hypothetical protein [archaeon]